MDNMLRKTANAGMSLQAEFAGGSGFSTKQVNGTENREVKDVESFSIQTDRRREHPVQITLEPDVGYGSSNPR
jgi:hypothetical protein